MGNKAMIWAAWARNKSKEYTDSAIGTIGTNMTYKGAKSTIAELPTEGNKKGDVWNVTEDSSEWVWTLDTATGDGWNELGTTAYKVTVDI